MTSQIFKNSVLAIALFFVASVNIHAQESSMQELIGQSLSKKQPTAESVVNCVAELKRIDAMFPDSVQPKYQIALTCLEFSVTNPHAPQTESLLAEAEQAIEQMKKLKDADESDIYTLHGFLYMTLIVQNPSINGQRYYMDVMEDYEKALRINPDNELAKQLQQAFMDGMRQATGGE